MNNIQLSPEGEVKSIQLSREGEVNSIQLPLKGRWIVVDILALWTDTEGDRGLSIFQISWIKIKKELFLNKRGHFVTVCLRFNWQGFRDHFFYDCCKFSQKFFSYRQVNTKKPNFVSFLVSIGAAASFTAKISSFGTVAKREAIFNLVPKQWISKDIPSYGSQSKRAKIAIHWFGEY